MNKIKMRLFAAGLFFCAAGVMPVLAQDQVSEEQKLEDSAKSLDTYAAQAGGHRAVTDRIKNTYTVNEERVQSLRDQKLGYGEISIVLGLAHGMRGGVTDANVEKIIALRNGGQNAGWGKIAGNLGVKLPQVTSNIQKLSAEPDAKVKEAAPAAEKIAKPAKGKRALRPVKPAKFKQADDMAIPARLAVPEVVGSTGIPKAQEKTDALKTQQPAATVIPKMKVKTNEMEPPARLQKAEEKETPAAIAQPESMKMPEKPAKNAAQLSNETGNRPEDSKKN